MQLTKQQIERQDFVDNQIYELIQKLIPSSKKLEWNIEIIGVVRDAIRGQVVDKKIITEEGSYSYMEMWIT